jgi:peroxiredoxin
VRISSILTGLCGLIFCLLLQLSSQAAANDTPAVGRHIADFTLPDTYGRTRSLDEAGEAPAVVIAFLGTECPLARLYGRRLGEMAREYGAQGVIFAGIAANQQDSLTDVAAYASRYDIEFPMLLDTKHEVADLLGARRTPEVFVLDANRVVRYHGRVDDQYGIGTQRIRPQRRDLAIALDEILAGKPVSVPQTPVSGCIIGRRRSVEPHGKITYASHVAEILNRRCVECHRDGEIAPFSLTSYEDIAGWEGMIAEVVSEGRMPPWNANPEFGHFANDARLSPDEKQTLLSWIENGCPLGDPAEIPPPPTFAEGWRIAEPDQIVYMSDESYEVPATGVVDYQYFEVDPGFTEDKFVTSVEARPGNTAVVHHIIAYLKPPGEEKHHGLGSMLIGYAPGTSPLIFPGGSAVRIPKGSTLIFELHYTPNGVAQPDRSYIGMTFTDEPNVTRMIGGGEAINHEFEIPPGESDHVVTATRKSPRDVLLISLTPHMHLRGKSFRYDITYPDGTEEVLLDVPRYDFNWQLRYELAEPKLIPKGSVLTCTAVFDNSEANPNNPDPTRTVGWGQQSWDEMMIGFYTYMSPEDKSPEETEPTSGP